MSKFAKLTLIFATALVAIAAKQFIAPGEGKVAALTTSAVAISPAEMMRVAAPLPEIRVENLF